MRWTSSLGTGTDASRPLLLNLRHALGIPRDALKEWSARIPLEPLQAVVVRANDVCVPFGDRQKGSIGG